VGGVTLSGSTDSPAYATTNDDTGEVTVLEAAPSDNQWNIKWDGSTLTLNGAKIKGADSSESLSATVGIYAFNSSGDVSLNIALKGVNEIFESSNGIWVYSSSSSTNAGNATLTIEGEGSLNASGGTNGIQVQSNSGNAALTIRNADVTAENSIYSGDGVTVRAGSSSSASLSVDGGSLTATGTGVGSGINFLFGSGVSGSGMPSLTVSGNTIVRANGGISDNSSTDIQIGGDNNSSGGIVFNNGTGTVYGDVTLQEALTIGEDESLTLDDGANLDAGGHNVIVDGGTLGEGLAKSLGESVKYAPAITTTTLSSGTVNQSYTAQLSATGSDTIKWSLATGSSLPSNLTLSESGEISGTPTAIGTSTFTVVATNDYGSDSKELSITIDARTDVPVTGVTLSQTELSLTEGGTAQLTATVLPETATNRNVTWSSNAPGVATVNSSGKVTAVSAGTATITVTTADGGKTATCEVTVTAATVPVTGVTLSQTQASLYYNRTPNTLTLTAT
ncbi:MAG: Ig domain-containing protein, partial [Evtepia sp.]